MSVPPLWDVTQTSPTLLIDPAEPVARERRAGHRHCSQCGEVVIMTWFEGSLAAGMDESRADAEDGDLLS